MSDEPSEREWAAIIAGQNALLEAHSETRKSLEDLKGDNREIKTSMEFIKGEITEIKSVNKDQSNRIEECHSRHDKIEGSISLGKYIVGALGLGTVVKWFHDNFGA